MPLALDLSGLSVLVVEDNEHMRHLLRMVLRALGIENVIEAENGEQAIEIITTRAPDIVFTDWIMQPVDGLELATFIRNAPESPNPFMPIIMVTAHSERSHVTAARDAGITEFLVKPISARAILSRLRAVIEHPRAFVRAPGYFGPDRRRRREDVTYRGPDRRGTGVAAPGDPEDIEFSDEPPPRAESR